MINAILLYKTNEQREYSENYLNQNNIKLVASYNLNHFGALILIIISMMYLKLTNRKLILISPPALFSRLMSVSLNLDFYMTMCTLHPRPEIYTSWIDKLNNLFETRLGFCFYMVNPYMSDYVITNSYLNRLFLESRNVNTNIIFHSPENTLSNVSVSDSRIIYIAGGFSSHNLLEIEELEKKLILKLIQLVDDTDVGLILRPHPRSQAVHENYKDKILISDNDLTSFIEDIRLSDIIISFPSSLSYRILSCGVKGIVVCDRYTAKYISNLSNSTNFENFLNYDLDSIISFAETIDVFTDQP